MTQQSSWRSAQALLWDEEPKCGACSLVWTACWQRNADGSLSQQPFLTKDTQGVHSPEWALPRHAGRQLQHEFESEKYAISSSAQPEKCCIGRV